METTANNPKKIIWKIMILVEYKSPSVLRNFIILDKDKTECQTIK